MKSKTFTASEILSFSLIVVPVNQNCGFDNLKRSHFMIKTNFQQKLTKLPRQILENVRVSGMSR